VYGVNDTQEEFRGSVRLVSCAADGGERTESELEPCLIPVDRAVRIGGFDGPPDPSRLYFAVLFDANGDSIAQHRALFARFHELNLVREPEIDMIVRGGVLTLRSEVFCWGVCLDAEGDRPVADNVFDLLPGIPYRLPWNTSTLGEPRLVRLGNRDALFPGAVPLV
jgi:beta-mannosidase